MYSIPTRAYFGRAYPRFRRYVLPLFSFMREHSPVQRQIELNLASPRVRACFATRSLPQPVFLGLSECPPGYRCPHYNASRSETFPQFCSPDPVCNRIRIFGRTCPDAQGLYDPIICRPGRYCPDSNTSILCPEGAFCPQGTVAPFPCAWYMSCPATSETPFVWGSILLTLGIDVCACAMIATCLRMHNGRVRTSQCAFTSLKIADH
jgi:hypothetical protein